MIAILAMTLFFESGTMSVGAYGAKTDLPDIAAIGGFAESKNRSWSMAEVNVEGKTLTLTVKKNACCVKGPDCPQIVVLSNGTSEPIWFSAADGIISLFREAQMPNGEWKPIEYRLGSDCGNSFHKVALNPGRAWIWDVPSSTGKTMASCRYVLKNGNSRFESAVFQTKINVSDFVIPDQYKKEYTLDSSALLVRTH